MRYFYRQRRFAPTFVRHRPESPSGFLRNDRPESPEYKAKAAMAIDPAIGIGFAPSSFFIQSPQLFGYDAFILLLFMPDRAFSFIHLHIPADSGQ